MSIEIGDKVQFDARGKTIRGTVTDVKFSRPGSRNALVRAYDLHTPTNRKLVVLPDNGGGVWTVPDHLCRKIGKGDKQAGNKAREIIGSIQRMKSERNAQRQEIAAGAGLHDLKKGDPIEVQFRQGWQKRTFSHMTASGQVGFTDGSTESDPLGLGMGKLRVRFTPAQFVRKATK